LAIDPHAPVGLLTDKGVALVGLRNYTGAIQYYDKALAIDPKNTDALNAKRVAISALNNQTRTSSSNQTPHQR